MEYLENYGLTQKPVYFTELFVMQKNNNITIHHNRDYIHNAEIHRLYTKCKCIPAHQYRLVLQFNNHA